MIAAMRTSLFIFTNILIATLIGACNFPASQQSISPQENDSVDCAFVWANEYLPELSDNVDKALKGIQPEAEGFAQAYGENCVTETGEVVRFHAMETDFHISLKVDDLGDEQSLGELIESVMNVLVEFPTADTPGPQPGYVGINFEAPDESFRLWVMRTEIESALENGLRGEELFSFLKSK